MEGFRTHKDLFLKLKDSSKDMNDYIFLYKKICEKIHISPENSKKLRIILKKFASTLKQKWIKARYTKKTISEI